MISDFIQKTIDGLDDASLADLETSIREAREQKRDRMDIGSIKPGMSAEDRARARAEIARVLGR